MSKKDNGDWFESQSSRIITYIIKKRMSELLENMRINMRKQEKEGHLYSEHYWNNTDYKQVRYDIIEYHIKKLSKLLKISYEDSDSELVKKQIFCLLCGTTLRNKDKEHFWCSRKCKKLLKGMILPKWKCEVDGKDLYQVGVLNFRNMAKRYCHGHDPHYKEYYKDFKVKRDIRLLFCNICGCSLNTIHDSIKIPVSLGYEFVKPYHYYQCPDCGWSEKPPEKWREVPVTPPIKTTKEITIKIEKEKPEPEPEPTIKYCPERNWETTENINLCEICGEKLKIRKRR